MNGKLHMTLVSLSSVTFFHLALNDPTFLKQLEIVNFFSIKTISVYLTCIYNVGNMTFFRYRDTSL